MKIPFMPEKMEKPHIKRFKTVDNFTVYIVDGEYIRKEMNGEFTNFGQHYRFKNMIPANEFWIDKESKPDEAEYFIKHMLTENKLMSKGKSYDKAYQVASKVQEQSRKGGKFSSGDIKISEIRSAGGLRMPSKDTQVWLVNGNAVRTLYDVGFTEGGHGYAYDYIPKNEIWVDNDLPENGRAFVILHEANERNLMKRGLAYDKSHQLSSLLEGKARDKPSLLKGKMSAIAKMARGG